MRLVTSYHLPQLENEVLQFKNSPRKPLWPIVKAIHQQILESPLPQEFHRIILKAQKVKPNLKSEQERYQTLNTLFFTFLSSEKKTSWLPVDATSEALILSSFYQYLGQTLEISLTFLSLENLSLIKLNLKESGPRYIDLQKQGQQTKYSDIVSHLKKYRNLTPPDSLTLLFYYLNQLKAKQLNSDKKILFLSLLIKLNPLDLKYYTERTLLMRDVGHEKLAYFEAKKMLSLFGRRNTPKEIQLLFYDIKNKEWPDRDLNNQLH